MVVFVPEMYWQAKKKQKQKQKNTQKNKKTEAGFYLLEL